MVLLGLFLGVVVWVCTFLLCRKILASTLSPLTKGIIGGIVATAGLFLGLALFMNSFLRTAYVNLF